MGQLYISYENKVKLLASELIFTIVQRLAGSISSICHDTIYYFHLSYLNLSRWLEIITREAYFIRAISSLFYWLSLRKVCGNKLWLIPY